jgi:hypothetical protein
VQYLVLQPSKHAVGWIYQSFGLRGGHFHLLNEMKHLLSKIANTPQTLTIKMATNDFYFLNTQESWHHFIKKNALAKVKIQTRMTVYVT